MNGMPFFFMLTPPLPSLHRFSQNHYYQTFHRHPLLFCSFCSSVAKRYSSEHSGKNVSRILTHSEYSHCASPLNLECIVLYDTPRNLAISSLDIFFRFISASKLSTLTMFVLILSFLLRNFAIHILNILRNIAIVNNFFAKFCNFVFTFIVQYCNINSRR